jgi:acyl-CoA thioesterase I
MRACEGRKRPSGHRAAYGAACRRINAALPILLVFLALLLPVRAPAADEARLLLLGDSLVAGYGLPEEEGFAARLQEALDARGHDVRVIDAGVSGDTSAGGLARLDWTLADAPTHALVELGANDGLRGLPPERMRDNLDAIIGRLKDEGVVVMLAGMYAPPNLGPDYAEAFDAVFPELAEEHDVLLYPFFLDGVATERALNQRDGIHPNADGVAVIVERILPYVERLLDRGG